MKWNCRVLFLLLFGFFLLAAVPEAAACTCITRQPVDVEFAETENVIVARLEGSQELSRALDVVNQHPRYAVTFSVEKVFKGGFKISETIKVLDGVAGGVCSMEFLHRKPGDRFLLFIDSPGGPKAIAPSLYSISMCGRSTHLDRAGPDLSYLENLAARKGQSRLSGVLRAGGENIQLPNVAGLKVELNGPVQRSDITKENGFFEFWDLPVGEYTISFSPPTGWKIGSYTRVPSEIRARYILVRKGGVVRAAITAGVHTEVNVSLSIDNEISGKVMSRKGKPVKDVCVSAYWLTPTGRGFMIPENCSDAEGNFRIEGLPPGKYRLEITANKRAENKKPSKTFFYPGTYDVQLAEPVTVDAGKSADGIVIKMID